MILWVIGWLFAVGMMEALKEKPLKWTMWAGLLIEWPVVLGRLLVLALKKEPSEKDGKT